MKKGRKKDDEKEKKWDSFYILVQGPLFLDTLAREAERVQEHLLAFVLQLTSTLGPSSNQRQETNLLKK